MSSQTNNIEFQIKEAVKHLSEDRLVAIPTETVYGLAANAYSENAIDKIFITKNRPTNNPLIVHIHSIEELSKIAINIPNEVYKLAEHFCPGPLTFILEKSPSISDKITAGKNTVAVRIPNHEVTLKLLRILDFPLVAPSANRSNHISPTCPKHVVNSLGTKTPFILNGGVCSKGIESTILGFENQIPIIYRLGVISKEEIEKVLGLPVEVTSRNAISITPGMQKKHYSPKTPFIASRSIINEVRLNTGKRIGYIFFTKKHPKVNSSIFRILSQNNDLEEAMANLYRVMHELDQLNLDLIISELLPNKGVGISINDRLIKASS